MSDKLTGVFSETDIKDEIGLGIYKGYGERAGVSAYRIAF